MALYEYFCDQCQTKFEQMSSFFNSSEGLCPTCFTKTSKKVISKFAVGGQGDLRESTLDGCHGPQETQNIKTCFGSSSKEEPKKN